MNKFVTIAVKITAGTGIHGTMDVAADTRMVVIPAVIHAAAALILAADPGAGFGGLLSLLYSCC